MRIPKENLRHNCKNFIVFVAGLPRTASNDCESRKGEEYQVKRRKSSLELRKFRAELMLIGRRPGQRLKEGEYHVTLNEQDKRQLTEVNKSKITFWEPLNSSNTNSFKDLAGDPCISFLFAWSEENADSLTHPFKPFVWKNAQPLKQIEPVNGEFRLLAKNDIRLHAFQFNQAETTKRESSAMSRQSLASATIVYRFCYRGKTLQQTKATNDFRCPWCGIQCLVISSLRLHLKFCHPRLCFSCKLDKTSYKIDVTMNEHFDGSYSGNPQFNTIHTNAIRAGPVQRITVTNVLLNLRGVARDKLNKIFDTDAVEAELVKPFVYGHNRLYYHSGTCQPIKPHELDVDSEDDPDPEWMRIKTQMVMIKLTLQKFF